MKSGRVAEEDDRAVSEVISVVLMVAVTIILAAMVGTVLLNIVSGVDKDPIAGASIKADAANDEITVTFVSAQQPGTTLEIDIYQEDGSPENVGNTLSEVGDTEPYTMSSDGTYRVIITAKADGKSAIINDVERSV